MKTLARTQDVALSLDASAVERGLARLAEIGKGDNLRRKVMRKAMKPHLQSLRATWRAAAFDRGGNHLHRNAIADAAQVDSRRFGAAGAVVIGVLGIRYGKKGGAKAGGRQRVYHLLERGFSHRSGVRVAGRWISEKWAIGRMPRLLQDIRNELESQLAKALAKGGR